MTEFVEQEIAHRKLRLEAGKLAKQSLGSVLASYGGTVVLGAVTAAEESTEGTDFLPLTIEYREKRYSVGKIPGGFFKRQGRPAEKEIVTGRLIDRVLRPLFSGEFKNETQVIATVFSSDQENDADIPAIIGASCALGISGLPFAELVGAARIGYQNGEFMINPTFQELENSNLDLVVAGTRNDILMLEGAAREVAEEIIIKAIQVAHPVIKQVIALQEELISHIGKSEFAFTPVQPSSELSQKVREFSEAQIQKSLLIPERSARKKELQKITRSVMDKFTPDYPEEASINQVLEEIQREKVRNLILTQNLRPDQRKPDQIRPISCEVGVLPRTHGSALFTRGQTQALACTTLGTVFDQQVMEELKGKYKKEFMLHYNFPPFSTGEVGRFRGPGRREIGHGYLAERALKSVLPSYDEFPYTIQTVSEILESNGSSSMATVCAGSLSLMDAGVPVRCPVAGIAMGLVKANTQEILLSDISGIEDHCGDMDLKIAGTRKGITALQMDLKTKGVTIEFLKNAFEGAREGRLFVLDKMETVLGKPRLEISVYAPQIKVLHIDPEKIGGIIGPGGKSIRKITETTGAEIDIEDDGEVYISAKSHQSLQQAEEIIKGLTGDVEKGKIYKGKVVRIAPFGAFVEMFPGKEGLVHISQLKEGYVSKTEDVVKIGDEVSVKVLNIDEQGKISLSMKEAKR